MHLFLSNCIRVCIYIYENAYICMCTIYICNPAHACMYTFIYTKMHTYVCVQYTYVTVHMYAFIHLYTNISTGWRRLIGCLKLQVIFRKRATNYRALLRKLTHEHMASYGSSPPCMCICACIYIWRSKHIYVHHGEATISRLLKIISPFANELYKRDDILQKRPMILRSLQS